MTQDGFLVLGANVESGKLIESMRTIDSEAIQVPGFSLFPKLAQTIRIGIRANGVAFQTKLHTSLENLPTEHEPGFETRVLSSSLSRSRSRDRCSRPNHAGRPQHAGAVPTIYTEPMTRKTS